MDWRRTLLSIGLLGLALGTHAQSLTPSELDQAARLGEQLLREQQQRQIERQQSQDRARQKPSGQDLPAAAESATTDAPDERCLAVSTLELIGAQHLPAEQVASLQAQVAGRCLGPAAINELLRKVTAAYVSRGYVTTRAYIPSQDTGGGRLTVVVIEGTVESIEVQPPGSISLRTAFPNIVGNILDLRQIEQGIDQLNRLASNSAQLDIRPGSAPGSSTLIVLNAERRSFTGSLATDNTGSPETGEWQGLATLSFDDLLDLNDSLFLTHQRSLDDPSGPASSRASSLGYSIPYGWWTANLQLSDSSYGTVVPGITRSFVTEGDSRSATLRVDRVAYRDQSRKLTLRGGVTRRSSENFVAGQLIGSSSRVLSALELDANLSVVQGGTLWSFDAGVVHGVDWFGSMSDPDTLPHGAPRAQFTKVTFGAGLSRSFDLFGLQAQIASNLAAQWSDDLLYPSEQIAVAGLFAVRGYKSVRLFGDRGFTWRNELAFPAVLGLGGAHALRLRPFVGIDAGRVLSHDETAAAYATGWAAGLTAALSDFNLQLSWSGAGPRSDSLASDHQFFVRVAAGF